MVQYLGMNYGAMPSCEVWFNAFMLMLYRHSKKHIMYIIPAPRVCTLVLFIFILLVCVLTNVIIVYSNIYNSLLFIYNRLVL